MYDQVIKKISATDFAILSGRTDKLEVRNSNPIIKVYISNSLSSLEQGLLGTLLLFILWNGSTPGKPRKRDGRSVKDNKMSTNTYMLQHFIKFFHVKSVNLQLLAANVQNFHQYIFLPLVCLRGWVVWYGVTVGFHQLINMCFATLQHNQS